MTSNKMENITVNEIIKKLKAGELESPDELSKYLVILSASLNTAGNLELDGEIDYAKRWEEIKSTTITTNGKSITDKLAEMKAKQTPEYRVWQEMRIANKTIIQTIQALKKRLANLSVEYNVGQNY